MLERANHLTGLDKAQFTAELAEHCEINTIHSFREGNTRTQFVFFSQLAENAGYRLDPEAFKIRSPLRDEFVAARFYDHATTRTDRLAAVLSKILEPVADGPAPKAQTEVLNDRRTRFPELFQDGAPGSGAEADFALD